VGTRDGSRTDVVTVYLTVIRIRAECSFRRSSRTTTRSATRPVRALAGESAGAATGDVQRGHRGVRGTLRGAHARRPGLGVRTPGVVLSRVLRTHRRRRRPGRLPGYQAVRPGHRHVLRGRDARPLTARARRQRRTETALPDPSPRPRFTTVV
jgi:hypothetical protein